MALHVRPQPHRPLWWRQRQGCASQGQVRCHARHWQGSAVSGRGTPARPAAQAVMAILRIMPTQVGWASPVARHPATPSPPGMSGLPCPGLHRLALLGQPAGSGGPWVSGMGLCPRPSLLHVRPGESGPPWALGCCQPPGRGDGSQGMPGRFHIRCALPTGRVAIAGYREPIVDTMHAIHMARELGQPPASSDIEAVTDWLDRHLALVALCGRGECDHSP